jgi:hypothetical protein
MECGNVRERLSEYIDNMLSPEDRVRIEEHLKSCAGCSAQLSDLKRTTHHINAMRDVEPPAWMTQKIMAKVREEGRKKKGIFQRLLYPLHIKLPLEAVAAVLVIGLALYVYRDIRPETRLAKVPTEEVSPRVFQKEIIKENKLGPLKKSEEKNIPQEVITAPERPVQEPTTGKKEATDKMEAAPKEHVPQKQFEFASKEGRASPSPATGEAGPATGILRQESKREAVQAAPAMKAFAKGEMENIVLTVKVKKLKSASEDIEKTVAALGGKVVESQYFEGRKTFVIELDSNRFKELLEKLKSFGQVKEEVKAEGQERALKLKIELF